MGDEGMSMAVEDAHAHNICANSQYHSQRQGSSGRTCLAVADMAPANRPSCALPSLQTFTVPL